VAAEAIEEAARRKNDPADLINIALERLVEGSYELPAFRTPNDMAATIRARVNEEIFALVADRLGQPGPAARWHLQLHLASLNSQFVARIRTEQGHSERHHAGHGERPFSPRSPDY